jgi:hypothetical protein
MKNAVASMNTRCLSASYPLLIPSHWHTVIDQLGDSDAVFKENLDSRLSRPCLGIALDSRRTSKERFCNRLSRLRLSC